MFLLSGAFGKQLFHRPMAVGPKGRDLPDMGYNLGMWDLTRCKQKKCENNHENVDYDCNFHSFLDSTQSKPII